MKTNKRIFIISVAIVAVIALTLGISFAAWDNSTATDDYVVVVGSNANMTVISNEDESGQVLVPRDQIGISIKDTKKVAVKKLSDITIKLNKDAEVNDLVVVYDITAIYSVPSDNTISFAGIKEMDADALKAAGIVSLNENYIDTTNGASIDNPRYVTGGTTIADPTPVGTDLRINLIDGTDAMAEKNYAVNDEIPFDPVTFSTAQLTLSMEFTRNATEEFKTKDHFLNKKIMIEITFTLKAKTTTPAPAPPIV